MFDTHRNVAPNCDRNSLVPLRASQSTLLCTSPSPSAQSLLERNAIANKIFRKLFHRKSRCRTKEDIMATATATTTTTTATTANALAASAADPNAPKSIPRQMLNGQMMLKYTNVVKGWQYRWFSVDAQTGILRYFLPTTSAEGSNRPIDLDGSTSSVFSDVPSTNNIGTMPRWQEHLAGAVIHPSGEDSRTFVISCKSGDTLKIRAANAQARQQWIDGLRGIAETHNSYILTIKHSFHRKRFSKKHFPSIGSHADILPSRENANAYTNARQQIHNAELCNATLARAVENCTSPLCPTDPDVLMLKALSAASTHCLLQCLAVIQRHHEISGDVRVRSHSEASF